MKARILAALEAWWVLGEPLFNGLWTAVFPGKDKA
jgi:hypothetical protein